MHDYYCKNCNNLIGSFHEPRKYFMYYDCYFIESKNIKSLFFLDCKNCKKFVGIVYYYVCKNCFGENEILKEETLFKEFLKYKKITNNDIDYYNLCNICKKINWRHQHWFFEELTFYKQ